MQHSAACHTKHKTPLTQPAAASWSALLCNTPVAATLEPAEPITNVSAIAIPV
jgi:hypothetical protein